MNKTAVFTHKSCLLHDTGEGHPERPQRLKSVIAALKAPEFSNLDWQDAPKATVAQLTAAHDPAYVQAVLDAEVPEDGYLSLDADTVLSPDSQDAALHAAGAVTAAVDHVMAGKSETAFCAVRPPGHHAERSSAMGFCVFANAAVGALHAVNKHGLKRVAIVDFDVHHGNGTADIVDGHPELFFASTHQYPFYPGTGASSEKGSLGNILNVPLNGGDGSTEFRKAFADKILPALENFRPELIIISAGFDAHKDDPLGQINLTEDDYIWVTEELQKIAARHAQGRMVSALEGGYNVTALASCVAAHVGTLMNGPAPSPKQAPPQPKQPF